MVLQNVGLRYPGLHHRIDSPKKVGLAIHSSSPPYP